jgi:hypothetical protein
MQLAVLVTETSARDIKHRVVLSLRSYFNHKPKASLVLLLLLLVVRYYLTL